LRTLVQDSDRRFEVDQHNKKIKTLQNDLEGFKEISTTIFELSQKIDGFETKF
jgi:hypothetical protein